MPNRPLRMRAQSPDGKLPFRWKPPYGGAGLRSPRSRSQGYLRGYGESSRRMSYAPLLQERQNQEARKLGDSGFTDSISSWASTLLLAPVAARWSQSTGCCSCQTTSSYKWKCSLLIAFFNMFLTEKCDEQCRKCCRTWCCVKEQVTPINREERAGEKSYSLYSPCMWWDYSEIHCFFSSAYALCYFRPVEKKK